MSSKAKTVFVGMSGGVDSSVAAALLKKEGHAVVGVFIKAWEPPGYKCTWREDRRDAMRVAAVLDIPFITLDLEEEYKKSVVDYMISEYQAGRTPNPDVMCNQSVKFGAFYEKARAAGADFVATGHYAQMAHGGGQALLKEAKDKAKDQSYFLWTMKKETAEHVLLPIGPYQKPDVRKMAEKFKLPNFAKKDSQGLCFLGQFDVKEFLKSYIKTEEGKVVNELGEIIGHHDGAFFYTIGERHGFEVTKKTPNEKPYYIVTKNSENNTLTVSTDPSAYAAVHNLQSVILEQTNWLAGEKPDPNKTYKARVRYHQEAQACTIDYTDNVTTIRFESPQTILATGQSLVLYNDDICLGGGVIATAGN